MRARHHLALPHVGRHGSLSLGQLSMVGADIEIDRGVLARVVILGVSSAASPVHSCAVTMGGQVGLLAAHIGL